MALYISDPWHLLSGHGLVLRIRGRVAHRCTESTQQRNILSIRTCKNEGSFRP